MSETLRSIRSTGWSFPIIEVERRSFAGGSSQSDHVVDRSKSVDRVEEILNERSLNLEKFQGEWRKRLWIYTAVKTRIFRSGRNQIRE